MAEFPRKESAIYQLAESMLGGLNTGADTFPAPPVPPDQLRASLETYRSARFKAKTASAEAHLATREKDEALVKLVADLKSNLRYAENTCGHDNATLIPLGWSGRRTKKPMEAPGEIAGIEILREGPGWIELSWGKPLEGGEVRAYRIERRKLKGGSWEIAGMSTATKAKLENQERGVHWMYRVFAVNGVGDGRESALAEAVL